ncbi:MAG: SHOCT domain-containing protein, partial [Pseudomonadota bacterium]|nr:SHOCT domain-containing protein [Pseudomonadota bacterium]
LPANRGGVMLGGLKKIGYFSIGLLGKLGLKNYFLSYQLKLTEKEFLRVKNIFDNGLITEEEFLAKKRDITSKIRSNNLLNKEFPD